MAVLLLRRKFLEEMVSHCLDGYPLEACGLLGGSPTGPAGMAEVKVVYRSDNQSNSARVYEVAPQDLMRADRDAEARGDELIGVYHSHTHTDAQPSETDVTQAPDPSWHYVLVSLRDAHPSVRSWAIRDGKIIEEPVVLQ